MEDNWQPASAKEIFEMMLRLYDLPKPNVAIDLDSPIENHPIFFPLLCDCWSGKTLGLTSSSAAARQKISKLRLRIDELVEVRSPQEKADVLVRYDAIAIISSSRESLEQVPASRARLLLL